MAKKKRSSSYSRTKGNSYERQLVKEINELGFDVGTSRNNSKALDNNKVDIYDNRGDLPISIQAKKTINIPNYFKIRSESSVDPETFAIIWAKQEQKEKNICTVGEVVLIDKKMFYKLIQPYAIGKSDSNLSESDN